MKSDLRLACCFTGYRPDKLPFAVNDSDPRFIEFENKLFNAVFSISDEGYLDFYCGGAMGFDLIAGETVILLKARKPEVKLHLVLPFAGHDKAWPETWKCRLRDVVRRADSVITLSEKFFNGCYQQRNRYMVDKSQAVLTYFDGKPSGTRGTVDYAARCGLPVINLAEYGVGSFEQDVELSFEVEE